MGYPLDKFGSVEIGNHGDTLFNSWTIFQAIDNLVHRPLNLGYAPIFYGDSNPFSYTIAPYGIAVVTLPFYFLSGSNMALTYNLYLVATFVLTALVSYWLLLYLLQCRPAIAILISLTVAFAQFRFVQFAHIESLSMQFYLATIYCLHRLLDESKWKWALGVAVSFCLNFLASGYLGLMAIVVGAIIILYALIRHPSAFTRNLVLNLVITCILTGLFLLPFLPSRLGNEPFSQGYSIAEIESYAATPIDWFSGGSQLYSNLTSNHSDEDRLFLGFIPLGLALAGWLNRRAPVQWAENTRPLFSVNEIVVLYAIISAVGYILSMGPVLKLSDQVRIPLPYSILLQLPGFSNLRVVSRFVFLPMFGMAVLGAYALSLLSIRVERLAYRAILVLLAVGLVVELTPPNGSDSPGILQAARQPGTAIELQTPAANNEIYQWLVSLPPGTPIVHYPGADVNVIQYIYDQRRYQQPMLNGRGSFYPAWYIHYWVYFPDATSVQELQARHAQYLLVHNEDMTTDEQTRFTTQITPFLQVNGGPFTFIQRLDLVDIYSIQPVISPSARLWQFPQ